MGPTLVRFVFVTLAVASLFSPPVNAGVTDDIAPCVVFLMEDVPAGDNANIGSGFLVRSDNTVLLVTASHVAKHLEHTWQMVMPGSDGRAVILEASNLGWSVSSTADAAIAVLRPDDPQHHKALLDRSLPGNLVSARPLPPSRDIPLTVMGYPLGIGATGYVSPISIDTRAASGFVTLERADNKKLATFILLQDPSVGGLSGGPVFDTGKSYFGGGRMLSVRSGVSLVGLVHGTISDKTGGKFAAIVPATEINKLISDTLLAH